MEKSFADFPPAALHFSAPRWPRTPEFPGEGSPRSLFAPLLPYVSALSFMEAAPV